jgi:hypothetical protein
MACLLTTVYVTHRHPLEPGSVGREKVPRLEELLDRARGDSVPFGRRVALAGLDELEAARSAKCGVEITDRNLGLERREEALESVAPFFKAPRGREENDGELGPVFSRLLGGFAE